MSERFTGSIEAIGTRTGIRLPFDPAEAWGDLDRYSVRGFLGNCQWRGKVEFHEGTPYISIGSAWFRDNPVKPGDSVEVELDFEGHSSKNVAEDVRAVLVGDAARRFDSLTSFDRNNLIRDIESAKRPETRAKRIAELVNKLPK